jgi:hypothetical protein
MQLGEIIHTLEPDETYFYSYAWTTWRSHDTEWQSVIHFVLRGQVWGYITGLTGMACEQVLPPLGPLVRTLAGKYTHARRMGLNDQAWWYRDALTEFPLQVPVRVIPPRSPFFGWDKLSER